MRTVGIIGHGFVGSAVARGFMGYADVRIYDTQKERSSHTWEEAAFSDFVFVCLPTPTHEASGCFDTSSLDSFFTRYIQHDDPAKKDSRCIVIKSTVPVGYTKGVGSRMQAIDLTPNIVHSPEFLTARCAMVDFQTPARNIVGSVEGGAEAANKLYMLYKERFPGVTCLMMKSTESEIVKLSCNSFFAMKVAFFNIVERMAAAKEDANFVHIRDGILSDGRIAHEHTAVPGPDGSRGFGGACLVKDISAFAECLEDDDDARLLRLVLERNKDHRGAKP